MSIDWTRIIIAGLLATAGVLLYILGPATSHQVAAGAVTGAVAVGGGAFRPTKAGG